MTTDTSPDAGIQSLPLIVRGDDGTSVFTSDVEPTIGDRVVGVGRRSAPRLQGVPVD